ncbi:MAG: hypothetical protein LBT38_01920 [Deltaproteobacteria bacterium]|jgi:hypothetical protein|nr:hypothetical protein [Deltaproteobacteria bacterium]
MSVRLGEKSAEALEWREEAAKQLRDQAIDHLEILITVDSDVAEFMGAL